MQTTAEQQQIESVVRPLVKDLLRTLETGVAIGATPAPPHLDLEALYMLGFRLYGQNRYEEAHKVFSYLVQQNQFEGRFLIAHAACLQMMKRYGEAITIFGVAALLDIEDPQPMFHSCECLIAMGRIEEAVDGLQSVLADCKSGRHDAIRKKAEGLLALMPAAARSRTGEAS